MTSSNGNIFRVTGHLCGEFTVPGQWRGALIFSLICVWINDWVNNGEAGDLRRYRARNVFLTWRDSVQCGVELLIRYQTLTVQPLKFGMYK